jgi:hypothetical protein
VIEEGVAAIAETTELFRSAFYNDVIQALAGFATAAIAGQVIEQVATATTKVTGKATLSSYDRVIQALARLAEGATARTAATTIIQHVAANIAQSPRSGLLEYAQTIRVLVGIADTGAAYTAATAIVEQASTAIAQTTDEDELQDYIQTIRALAGFIDSAVAAQGIEQATAAIAKTTDCYQLRAYAQTIQALAGSTDATVARAAAPAAVERSLILLDRNRETSELDAFADTMFAIRREVPGAAWMLAVVEMLKHPLCGDSEKFEDVIAEHCGIPETAPCSLWDVVSWIEEHEPWLPLRTPFRPVEEILKDFAYLLEHEPPLPAS